MSLSEGAIVDPHLLSLTDTLFLSLSRSHLLPEHNGVTVIKDPVRIKNLDISQEGKHRYNIWFQGEVTGMETSLILYLPFLL